MSAPRVRWCFHGTAAVRDHAAVLAWLERICGCRELEYSDHPDPQVARKGGVSWIGDAGLELMEPTRPDGAPARFLARYGPGLFGIALQVEDLDEAVAHFRGLGVGILGDRDQGWIFTHPKDTASVYLEWADKDFGTFDPHFGAPLPARRVPPRIEVPRVAWFGALVEDPPAALDRLQALWPAPRLFEKDGADPATPYAGLSLGDCALQLFRLPDGNAELERLWGPLPRRPRVHAMALRVRDLAAAAAVLAEEGVRVLRGDPRAGALVTHPDDTGGLLLVWTDRDLPGDPRGPLA